VRALVARPLVAAPLAAGRARVEARAKAVRVEARVELLVAMAAPLTRLPAAAA
jgi:hypothetical protein